MSLHLSLFPFLNAQVIQFKDNADLNFEDARLRLNIIEAILNDLDND